MTEEGTVVTIQENFPDDLQFMTDGVGPNENPVGSQTVLLNRARLFDEETARIVADRVREFYDDFMPDHEVEVGTRKVEVHMEMKEK